MVFCAGGGKKLSHTGSQFPESQGQGYRNGLELGLLVDPNVLEYPK